MSDHSEVFEKNILETYTKLNRDFENIRQIMNNTCKLYFSDTNSPEWKYVLSNLFIFKQIGELNAQSKELLSVKNNKVLRTAIEHLTKIAIYSKLQPKLPGYISKQYVKSDDIFYSYNILKCTSFTLCEFIDCPTLRVAILSEGLRAILVALYQIAHCPLKVSNQFSQDIYKKLLEEKVSAVSHLKNLQAKVHSTLFVKETMGLVQPNSPAWFKKAVFQTLNDIILSKNGVEIISVAMLDGTINDKTQTWKAVDIISKLILSCKSKENLEMICNQVSELLDKVDEHNLVYERIFVSCLKELNFKDPHLEKNIYFQKLVEDLRHFIDKKYDFKNKDITVKVNQILRLIHTLFLDKGVENPNLSTQHLVKYLDVIFILYSITYNEGNSIVNEIAKDIIIRTISDNKKYVFSIFDGILFNIHTKTLPFRRDLLIEINNQKIWAKNTDYSVTYSLSEKSEILKSLCESDSEILYDFFGYLLNCIAQKDKYFKKENLDLEEILDNTFVKKIVVYKLLSELAETKCIQKKLSETPQQILLFIHNILKNCIENREHTIKDNENEQFQSLFTIVMVLQALISQSTNGYKDYQEILSHLSKIQSETPHLELSELIKNILKSAHAKEDENIETNKEKSELEVVFDELSDPLLPVRGHGLMSLTKLVEKKDPETMRWKQYILTIFQENLKNRDSFIYLTAINGLAALASSHTLTVLSTLCDEYSDFSRNDEEGHETRMKLGEVLVKVTKSLGDRAPEYKALLINTFLSGTKDDDYLVRASSLSNLGEVCRVLGYKLSTVVTEILDCVHNIITTDKSVEARRAAVTVLRQLLAGLENDMIAFLKEEILPIYRTLKHIYNNDSDDIMRLQAQLALEELNNNMKNFLFLNAELTVGSKLQKLS